MSHSYSDTSGYTNPSISDVINQRNTIISIHKHENVWLTCIALTLKILLTLLI